MAVSMEDIKRLRTLTGAGMMDVKKLSKRLTTTLTKLSN